MTHVSNILLLDAEDLMREATALLLVNRGAEVTKSASPEEASVQLARQTFEVVIVDVHEDAREITWLRDIVEKASPSARVIVCTEKPLSPLAGAGIHRVLVKPYAFDRLVEAVFGTPSQHNRGSRLAVRSFARRVTMHRRAPSILRRGRA
ncbi:MAG TPA: response regulator [Polyangium sp.]|nr:response regulator [Polyangium sp.]